MVLAREITAFTSRVEKNIMYLASYHLQEIFWCTLSRTDDFTGQHKSTKVFSRILFSFSSVFSYSILRSCTAGMSNCRLTGRMHQAETMPTPLPLWVWHACCTAWIQHSLTMIFHNTIYFTWEAARTLYFQNYWLYNYNLYIIIYNNNFEIIKYDQLAQYVVAE